MEVLANSTSLFYLFYLSISFQENCRDDPANRTPGLILFSSFIHSVVPLSLFVSQIHGLTCQATFWLCALAGSVLQLITHLFSLYDSANIT